MADLHSCADDCMTREAAAHGSCVVNSTCICINAAFHAAVSNCIITNCPDQLGAAQSFLQETCNALSIGILPGLTGTGLLTSNSRDGLSNTSGSRTKSSNRPRSTDPPKPRKSPDNVGAIAVGVIVLVALIVIVTVWWVRRSRRLRARVALAASGGNRSQNNYGDQPLIPIHRLPSSQGVTVVQHSEAPGQALPPPFTRILSDDSTVARQISRNSIDAAPPEYDAVAMGPNASTNGPVTTYPGMVGDLGLMGAIPSIKFPLSSSETTYNDIIGQYATANRDIISSDLERRLRMARYLPTDNPSDMPAEEWGTRYGVGIFELRRLQELYDRNETGIAGLKETHS